MPQNEHEPPEPLVPYILLRRDPTNEQMNTCYFSAPSDEAALRESAEFLGIPELSEVYMKDVKVGHFELSRKDGTKIFPKPEA